MIRRACCALTRFMSICPGVRNRTRHGRLRDLLELRPPELRRRESGTEDLPKVPADRLSFAVGIGGEEDGAGSLPRPLQLGEDPLLPGEDFIARLVPLRPVDGDSLSGEVSDVAVARPDGEVLPEELGEGVGLGGRLDDDKGLRHEADYDGMPVKPVRRGG